ncbi:hypothetical protein [Streptomyces sp. NRRL B-24572]|uniref:hypothetical protein n=1 Tax=Streptomyces sp. NRRL B-24572 TaxID=1962156 RepID=UPI000A3692C3|nr:hypothetical protein [Streptomyces sp. NRRL B-24572]
MNHADGTAPIYAELIRERGDVPGDVRQVAEEVLRDLSRVIQMPPQGMAPQGMAPQGMAPQGAVVPAGAPHPGVGGPMGVGGPGGMLGQAGAVVPHRPMH